MASYEVDAYGATVRRRDPVIVVVLTLVTFGLYNLIWYYRINRELRDFGRIYRNELLAKERPWLSVLAVTLGGILIFPPIVSYWRTTSRIRRAQEIVGEELTNGWVLFACYVSSLVIVLPGLVIPGYVQSGLNSVWDRYQRRGPGSPQLDAGAAGVQVEVPAVTGERPDFGEGTKPDPRWDPGR